MNYKGSLKALCGFLLIGTALEVSPHETSSSNLYFGTKDGIKITNANTTPSLNPLTKPGVGSISDIHFRETENDLFVTYYNYGNNVINVFYSPDNGANWENKEGNDGVNDLPVLPVYSILNNPYEEDEVIVGTELGVRKTLNFTDSNPNWSLAYEGMSDVAVFDMDFRGTSAINNRVIAGTFGRGVYVSQFTANTNPPVSVQDAITVLEGGTATTTTAASTSVLSNDSDPDGDTITADTVLISNTINGILVLSSTGTFTYTHDDSETTTDSFSYRAYDGALYGNTVSVAITITPVNDPPLTVTENLSVLEGGTATTTTAASTSVLSNDTDNENNALEAILTTQAINGNVVISSTGTFTYIHDGSETTTDTFQYRAAEVVSGLDGNVILVNIAIQEVNDCPVYTAVGGFPVADEDGAPWTWDYGAKISDADGNTPMYTLTHTATSLLTATSDANGIVTFTPKPNQFGTTTMTLNVADGRGCDIDIEIPVTINSINDCPTLENQTLDVAVNEDDPDLFIPLANIFEDIDTNTLNYTTTIGDSSIVATSITATALIIDFLPNQSGSTFINLIALDGDPNCTIDNIFTVIITPINDAPIGVGEVINLVSGATTSILNDGVTSSVLANDSDPEGSAITADLLTASVNGSITLSTNGNFSYTHDGSATVTDSFTYKPSDGLIIGNTTTVTIFINNVPIGVTETIALFEGGTATTTTAASTSVLSNDTDVDSINAILTANNGTSPLFGTLALNPNGSFTYTHLGSEDFTDSFTYIPFDGKGYGLPTVVSVTITPTNDAPVAFADSITVGVGQTTSLLTGGMNNVLMNDIDPDGDSLTATLVISPTEGTLVLNPGGTFSYIQNGIMNSGDSFTYKANDGSIDSSPVTVNINLTCSPCTEKTIEAGSSGVIISYRGCGCRTYDVYVPKGKVFIFCHLDGSVVIGSGSYTVLSSKVCY